MLMSKKKDFGFYPVSSAIKGTRWLLLAFILCPIVVTGSEITTPDTVGNVGRFTSLALNAKGKPVVSYYDLANRDLKLLLCDDPYCSGDETGNMTVLDATGSVGTYSSLVLDGAEKPVVSYFDASNGNLKLLRCDSPDCATSNTSIPDALGIVGRYASITLDDVGNPVVSYYDDSNGDLKLLHCDDPKCAVHRGRIQEYFRS